MKKCEYRHYDCGEQPSGDYEYPYYPDVSPSECALGRQIEVLRAENKELRAAQEALSTELSELRTKLKEAQHAQATQDWLKRERALGSIDMDYP